MANDKPVTRKERFLAGAAGEDITLDTPITREERFLAKAAGMDVKTDAPVTRSEKYLAKIAEGGGGGGSVPEYEGAYTVTPSESTQTLATDGKKCTDDITVNPISSTYIGSGVTQKAAATYTPTTSDQTIAANQYLAGAQTVEGVVCENLTAGNIKKDVVVKIGTATDDDSVSTVTGTYEGSGGGQDPWDEEPPNDGKTRIYIDLVEGYKSPYLGMQLYSGASKVIDWGDGTDPEESSSEYNLHNYEHGGKYIITVEIKNANAILKGYLSTQIYASACGYLLTAQDSYTSQNIGNKNNYYANAVKKIYIGQNVEIQDGAFVNFQGLTKISLGSALIYGTSKKLSQAFRGCVNLTDIDLTQTNIKDFGDYLFQNCFRLSKMIVPSNLLDFSGKYIYSGAGAIPEIVFLPTNPPTASYSHSIATNSNIKYYVPVGSLAAYLTATNYPSPSTYTYIGFGTFADGATLKTEDTTASYALTWYATKADAIAQTNPITVGNGNEIYCRYTAV